MPYLDFVLQLDRASDGHGFVARVLRSPAGKAEAPFVNPLSPPDLDSLWQAALATREAERGTRDLRPSISPSLAAELSLEELGGRLFNALFRGDVHRCWTSSLDSVARDSQGGLRLKLEINLADPHVAALADLPWEYLYSLEHGGFLGLQRKTPIQRFMRLAPERPPEAPPLRLLTILSQPRSMSRLSLEEEDEKIAIALGTLPGVELLPLLNPTIETLREALLRREFHILHFMGHGGFDRGSGQGVLYFTDSTGAPLPVSGSLLASHLAGLDSLRLVFVNACDTARAGVRAPFAGVATALLRVGLPAVIAMQRPIRDSSALEFSRTVYRRLATGDSIDAAVTEGRLAIARGHGALLEWGTPVLYSRVEDGRLFAAEAHPSPQILTAGTAAPPPRPRRSLYAALLAVAVATGTGVALRQWPFEQEPPSTSDISDFDQGSTPDITTDVEPEPPRPKPEPDETFDSKKPAVDHEQPPKSEPEPVRPPVPAPPSSYALSDGSPVSIPDLNAEVGAQFYERQGHRYATFWVAPSGQGTLQQPPVVGPGSIAFPASSGTYHLDVLSLDLTEKRASIRLRFAP
jgi:hypothetical protein